MPASQGTQRGRFAADRGTWGPDERALEYPAPPSPPGAGDTLEGLGASYRLQRPLAQGGTATIYLAEREPGGGEVVIKIARPDMVRQSRILSHLRREAALLGRLAHPHCVPLIGSGLADGVPYLVMQKVGGRTLTRLLADAGVSPDRAVTIARQVLSALHHAHSRGVLHQDVKADNIHVAALGDGRDLVTLLDFGAARNTALGGSAGDPKPLPLPPEPDAQGTILGTPSVMAPEQIRLEPVDARADVYAAGILLYQLLVGYKPFYAADTQEVLLKHLHEEPKPPRRALGRGGLSAGLEEVVLRALRKDASDRFDSCAAMASALRETPEGRGRRRRRAARSRARIEAL